MPSIFKMSGYYIDPTDSFGSADNLEVMLESDAFEHDSFIQQLHVEKGRAFAYDDDAPEFQQNCDLAVLDSHFDANAESFEESHKKREIEINRYYKHFKGHIVYVFGVARDTEHTDNRFVLYEHVESGKIWARPYAMFASEVDHKKYPDVNQKYRFELIGMSEAECRPMAIENMPETMTRLEYIRRLPIRDLAEQLVKDLTVNEGDEDCDGEFVDFYVDYFTDPEGNLYWSHEDAVDATVAWLQEPFKDGDI